MIPRKKHDYSAIQDDAKEHAARVASTPKGNRPPKRVKYIKNI